MGRVLSSCLGPAASSTAAEPLAVSSALTSRRWLLATQRGVAGAPGQLRVRPGIPAAGQPIRCAPAASHAPPADRRAAAARDRRSSDRIGPAPRRAERRALIV